MGKSKCVAELSVEITNQYRFLKNLLNVSYISSHPIAHEMSAQWMYNKNISLCLLDADIAMNNIHAVPMNIKQNVLHAVLKYICNLIGLMFSFF